MSTPLISEKMNNQLNKIIGFCFDINRTLDRQMSQLSIKFVMNKTSNILHGLLAHSFPLIADKISDYQDSRNCMTIYPSTHMDDKDYNTPLEIFEVFLENMQDLENLVSESILLAKLENDRMTKEFLVKFLLSLQPFTNQALLLCDKMEKYGETNLSYMLFDANINDFIVVEKVSGR